ncbi:MAG TPA: hypothetical protein VLJ76_07770 [Gaiellaceae bacterium]|nr:hypothetical protein [Gaiellaceae bacterium]
MTALILVNTIAAAVVAGGLVAATRFGHLTAGGRFERTLRRLELREGAGRVERPVERPVERELERRAA